MNPRHPPETAGFVAFGVWWGCGEVFGLAWLAEADVGDEACNLTPGAVSANTLGPLTGAKIPERSSAGGAASGAVWWYKGCSW